VDEVKFPSPSKVSKPVPTAICTPELGSLSDESANHRYVVDVLFRLSSTVVSRTAKGMPSES